MTGSNLAYKAYQRDAYAGFDAAQRENLCYLKDRIGGAWAASRPVRINMPKSSGLQRTISVLDLEDQIVLQCLAQAFERTLRTRRKKVTEKYVFSSVATPSNPYLFVEDWRSAYPREREAMEKHFREGKTSVASFDLAAFFDTIAHDRLLGFMASDHEEEGFSSEVKSWLSTWALSNEKPPLAHGLPQGPQASAFLADCYLLPIDNALVKDGIEFVRYVDDFHLFADGMQEARRSAIALERYCKAQGLIAQGGKSDLWKVRNSADLDELMKKFSGGGSVGPRDPGADASGYHEILRGRRKDNAVRGNPLRVRDRTDFRFAMYHSPKDRRVRDVAVRLLATAPEHIDAIAFHLMQYSCAKPVTRVVAVLLREGPPHDYVEFHLWGLAERLATVGRVYRLSSLARIRLRALPPDSPARWAAFSYLLAAEGKGGKRVSHLSRFQSELGIMHATRKHGKLLMSRTVAGKHILVNCKLGGLAAAEPLAMLGRTHRDFGLRPSDLPYSTQGAVRAFGSIRRTRRPRHDPIGGLLKEYYEIKAVGGWMAICGSSKGNALGLLRQAVLAYETDKSKWLRMTNSFHELLVRAIVRRLRERGLGGAATKINEKNDVGRPFVRLGNMVNGSPFQRSYPEIAAPIAAANLRRHQLPDIHSEDYRTGRPTKYLTTPERDKLKEGLATTYGLIAKNLDQDQW